MAYLGLIIACFMATISPSNGKPKLETTPMPKSTAINTIEQSHRFETILQMRESGMTQMDGYERYMAEPKLNLNAFQNA